MKEKKKFNLRPDRRIGTSVQIKRAYMYGETQVW